MRILSDLLRYVKLTSFKYNIDESHALGHSMKVLYNAHQIYHNNVHFYPVLKTQEPVIYTSAIIHDMCDKKYINQSEGAYYIEEFLSDKMDYEDIVFIKKIIETMSYSTVKKKGYPVLGKYQMAYHIVREADLLTSYDFDRSIIYHMYKTDGNFTQAYQNALELFENRIFKYQTDNLFITEYSKRKACQLEKEAIMQINTWKYIIGEPRFPL